MSELPEDGKTLCYCRNVSYGTVRESVREGARTLDEVMKRTTAGTGCRSCQYDIENVFAEIPEPQKRGFFGRILDRIFGS